MTFKNGRYLEYYQEKHQNNLITEFGAETVTIITKINEIVARMNYQDEYIKILSEWANDVNKEIGKMNVLLSELKA